jgi:hypothetical protein
LNSASTPLIHLTGSALGVGVAFCVAQSARRADWRSAISMRDRENNTAVNECDFCSLPSDRHATSTLRGHARTMLLERICVGQRICIGSLCPQCGKGTMTIRDERPIRNNFGVSRVLYQCKECEHVATRMQDQRFL